MPDTLHDPAVAEFRRTRPPLHIPSNVPHPISSDYSVRCRLMRANQCSVSPMLQAMEMRRCADSVVYWVNQWVWTADQRSPDDMRESPFDLFAIQMEFLLWIKELHKKAEAVKRTRMDLSITGLVEKSRGQGATWLAVAYGVHGWLFSKGFVAGYGSLKLDEVDQIGNLSTILEKARFILRRLPLWMMPANYDELKHATHCKILNHANGAAIVGEGGDNMGRGGKSSIFFVDESAHLLNSKSVDKALAETSNCKIHISTPRGAVGGFYEKVSSGNFPVFRMHWLDDPRKDAAWAEAKKKELNDPVAWAEEYEIDYTASVEGICILAAWVHAAVDLVLPGPDIVITEGSLEPVDETAEIKSFVLKRPPKIAGLDCSGEGANRTVLIPKVGPYIEWPISWQGLDTTQSAHRAAMEAEKIGVVEMLYDASGIGIGYKSAWKACDPPMTVRTHPINTGNPPTETKWPDGKMSKEKFVNQRAEFWWMLRTRFEKAFEFKEKGVLHPADEMISIPNHPQLIRELSMPLYEKRDTGKVCMESKKDMRKRGIKSPDYADALVLACAQMPRKKRAVFW